MKIKFQNLTIILVISLIVIINIYFLLKIFYLEEVSFIKDNKQEVDTFQELKQLQQALRLLETRKPFAPQEIATEGANLKQKTTLNILNGSGAAGMANTLKKDLTDLEPNWEITTGNTEATASTILGFKTNVSPGVRTTVLDVVSKQFPKAAEEELSDESSYDIVIILGTPK